MPTGMSAQFVTTPSKFPHWTISLAERPVPFSLKQDMALFGKPFSHPFIVFKNPHGYIVSEMHATWPKPTPKAHKIGNIMAEVTGTLRHDRINAFLAAAAGELYPKVVLACSQGERQYASRVEEQLLFAGQRGAIVDIWKAMVDVMPHMNAQPKPFYRYARPETPFSNCQIAIRTVMETVCPRDIPDLKLAQTGWCSTGSSFGCTR